MDFIEEIRNLSVKITRQRDAIKTEEATKTAFVMPFIKLLGYDVFNPTEVVPESTADVGKKQGEKVDYAVRKDGEVIMIIECKKFGTDLSDHTDQLYRYFSNMKLPPVAILTNGALYRFYTDLERANLMDTKPFLEFDILDIQEPLVNELKRFTKSAFDLKAIRMAARELKYSKQIKQILVERLETPTKEFVQFCLSSIYSDEITPAVVQQFTGIVKRTFHQLLDEQINQRSQSVASNGEASQESVEVEEPDASVVSSPNDWSRGMSRDTQRAANQELPEKQQRLVRYWTGLREHMTDNGSSVNCPAPRPWRYIVFSIGRAVFSMETHLVPIRNEISIRLCIDYDNVEAYFYLLQEQREAIEKAFGEPLEWDELPGKKRSRISLTKADTDPLDENDWPHQYEWFTATLERFNDVFRERIRGLDAADWRPEADAL